MYRIALTETLSHNVVFRVMDDITAVHALQWDNVLLLVDPDVTDDVKTARRILAEYNMWPSPLARALMRTIESLHTSAIQVSGIGSKRGRCVRSPQATAMRNRDAEAWALIILLIIMVITAQLIINRMDARIFEAQSCLFPLKCVIGSGSAFNRTDREYNARALEDAMQQDPSGRAEYEGELMVVWD